MRLICGYTLAMLFIITFFHSYKKSNDVFSPLCFFSFYQFIRYVPVFISSQTEDTFQPLFEDTLIKVFVIEILVLICVNSGYDFYNNFVREGKFKTSPKNEVTVPTWIIVLLFIVGTLSRVKMLMMFGGVNNIFNNMGKIYASTGNSNGYTLMLTHFATIAIIMQIKKASLCDKNTQSYFINWLMVILMTCAIMASYLVFSSRSPALELLMIAIFAYHYLVNPIRIRSLLNPKIFALLIGVFAIIIIAPALRQNTRFDLSLMSFFDEFSCVGRDSAVYSHFNHENYWLGKSYISIIYAPIPSKMMTNKPIIDDGLYLYNIIRGYDVEPFLSANQIPLYNSVPFSSQGCLYANFGIIGVVLGEFILGIIYARVYKKLKDTHADYMVIIYQLVIYQLELSALSIVQTLVPFFIVFFTYSLLGRYGTYHNKNIQRKC